MHAVKCRLTCKGVVCLDGGELQGHLMLVSVDHQMGFGLEALCTTREETHNDMSSSQRGET